MNKIFLDSNIILYLYATDEVEKNNKAENILQDYDNIDKALQEFHTIFNIAIISYDTLRNALKIASKYKYSFPDSLIVGTALEYNCDILFSEDMHHGQVIENNLKILNPFI